MPRILITGCPWRQAEPIIALLHDDYVIRHRETPVLEQDTDPGAETDNPDAVIFVCDDYQARPLSDAEESFITGMGERGIPLILVTGNGRQQSPPASAPRRDRNASRWISETIPLYSGSRAINDSVRRAILKSASGSHESKPRIQDTGGPLLGTSKAIREVNSLIIKYAASGFPLLIYGETGTGKEIAARSVHRFSRRGNRSFIARNCAAIPLPLIETELFGSERGAYTDAISRPGCFQLADKGSLFLDEIGDLLPSGQAKLLRAIEAREILPVGGVRPVPVDVRIISATNRNLKRDMKNRRFRSDLYYRINTLQLFMPTLRERKEDIPLLLDTFLREEGETRGIDRLAMEKLLDYDWPGNVRELLSVVKRALVFSHRETISDRDILYDRE